MPENKGNSNFDSIQIIIRTVGGPPLTCSQQSTLCFSDDEQDIKWTKVAETRKPQSVHTAETFKPEKTPSVDNGFTKEQSGRTP